MARFVAHVHKELRDQRAVLIAVFAALPVLTFIAYWSFGNRLLAAPGTDVAGVMIPIAMALYLLAMAGDVFAGDVRRGTTSLLRRQPGGMGYALAAKASLVAVGLLVVLLWQSLVLLAAWWLWGTPVQTGFGTVVEAALLSPLTAGAVILAFWILLTSTWLQQGGVAVLLAPLLLGILCAPAVVWALGNKGLVLYFVPDAEAGALLLAAALCSFALLATAWSWIGGRGVVRSAWSAAWRGLAVVLVLTTSTYAVAALHVHATLDLTPACDDLRIQQAFMSPSGRRLHVEVTRQSSHRRFPTRTWSVDVKSGAWHAIGGWDESVVAPPMNAMWCYPGSDRSSLEPQPRLVQYRWSERDDADAAWIDAETGEILKVVPASVRTRDVREWTDEASRRATWHRDADGRRVWLEVETNAFRREGQPPEQAPELRNLSPLRPAPGGWWGWNHTAHTLVFVDAASGTWQEIADPRPHGYPRWFAPGRCLVLRRDHVGKRTDYLVLDARTGTERAGRDLPEGFAGFVLPLETGRPVTLMADPTPHLATWDPVGGEVAPFTWPEALDRPIRDIWLLGRDAEGNAVLAVDQGHWTLLVVDPQGAVRVLKSGLASRPQVCALMPDGSAFAIEGHGRIVRYRDDRREVVFPR